MLSLPQQPLSPPPFPHMEGAENDVLTPIVPSGYNLYEEWEPISSREVLGPASAICQHRLCGPGFRSLMGDSWHKLQRAWARGADIDTVRVQSLFDPALPQLVYAAGLLDVHRHHHHCAFRRCSGPSMA